MAILSGNWYRRGWGRKTIALAGLSILVSLDPRGPGPAALATLGTAHTLQTMVRRRKGLGTLLWVAAICLLFAGLTAWFLHRWVPGDWCRLYLAALAFMVITQDELPEHMA